MSVPLSDHRSPACMCVHVREHTCDVEKDEPICSAKFEYYFRMCGYVKANVYVIVICCERTKRVVLHQLTVEGETVCSKQCWRCGEVKEVAPRSMPGGRESHIWGDAAIVQAQVGVVKIASGYTFMIGKVVRGFRVKPYGSY